MQVRFLSITSGFTRIGSLFVFFSLLCVGGYAQNILHGRLTDAENGEALTGATILLEGTGYGAKTDISGNYTIKNIPDGSYTLLAKYVSYQTKSELIILSKKVSLEKNITLDKSHKELKNVKIKASKKTNTERGVMTEIRNAQVVSSGVSAAQIAKAADRNAAEVIKRVPGVTIINDRFINIRGLNERYNEVWLNNATAPSAETDIRAFSFDVIPSGVIDRILVFKTPSAELPGNFAGGAVKIFTTSMPDKDALTFSYSSSYRNGSTFQPYYYTQRSKTDYLGYDNSYRVLPKDLPEYISKNDANNSIVTGSFKNNWEILKKNASPDQRFQINFQKHWQLNKRISIGNVSSASYSSTSTTYNVMRADYDSNALNYKSKDIQSTHAVQIAAMENLAIRFGNHKIEWKNLLNQSGKEMTTLRSNDLPGDVPYKYYAMGYMCKRTLLSQLAGTHQFEKSKIFYDWTLSYNNTYRNEPDLRRINYTQFISGNDTLYKAQVANVVDPIAGGGRFYQSLTENSFSLNHNVKRNFNMGKISLEMTAGNFIENRTRNFTARVLGYTIKPGFNAYNLTLLDIDTIFSPQNVRSEDQFKIDETTSLPDSYTASNFLLASYVASNIRVGDKLNVKIGARYEYNEQKLNSFTNLDSNSKVSLNLVTKFLLPSLNVSYNINKKQLIRFAAGQTLNRPEFREIAPFFFYDFDLRIGNYGSLYPTTYFPKGTYLKVAKVMNADIRYEWYGEQTDMFHVGVFYKHFTDPIQKVITSDYKGLTYINAKSATVYGIEMEARKSLSFIPWKEAKSFTAICNVTLQKSNLILPDFPNQLKESRLQGQSPYVVNAGIYYQNDSNKIQASLLYNVFGSRIFAIGSDFYGSTAEAPFHSLDAMLSYKINRYLSISGSIQNLLDQQTKLILDNNRNQKFEKSDATIKSYKMGSYFTLGARINLLK